MTDREVAEAGSLLARKGFAAPAARGDAAGGRGGAAEAGDLAAAPSPAVPWRGRVEPGFAAQAVSDPAPAASLLPFDFLGAGAGGVEIVASLDSLRSSNPEPERAPEESAAAPTAAEEPKPAAAGEAAAPVSADASAAARAAPRADPAWRIGAGLERPDGRGRWVIAAVIGLALVGVVVWQMRLGTERADGERPAETSAVTSDGSETVAPAAAPGTEAPAAKAQDGAPPAGTAGKPAAESPAPDAEPDAEPAAAPAGAAVEPAEIEPSVDIVRIEDDGAAVIAGRAAPGSEIIVLDNGTPIGTAKADAYGEWVFIPDAPLPSGAHEFGLVVKSVEGRVVVPSKGAGAEAAPETDAEEADPAPDAEAADPASDAAAPAPADRRSALEGPRPERKPLTVPTPARKPDGLPRQAGRAPAGGDGAWAGSDFLVQLASVKTRAGAEREWRDLQRRFPELLANVKVRLDEAELPDGASVVRLRAAGFAGPREAAALCEHFAARRQGCLVVRVSRPESAADPG